MTSPADAYYPLDEPCARRLLHFYELLCQVHSVPGDIVECGVGSGETLFYQAVVARLFGQDRHLYGFDSFQGLSAPTAEDEPQRDPDEIRQGRFAFSRQYVLSRLAANGLDRDYLAHRVHLVEGWLCDTLDRYRGPGIAFLHLDLDLFEPYKLALERLYPRINPGGIVAFDEYRDPCWVGATRAVDEYFAGRVTPRSSHVVHGKYYVVKE